MRFFKKLKETAEKSIEKGTELKSKIEKSSELCPKGYEDTKDAIRSTGTPKKTNL